MYCIIKFAGHQYKVKKGDRLTVNSLNEKKGAKVTVDKVLMGFDEKGAQVNVGTPYIAGNKVELKVLGHKKEDKKRVFKMKPKKRYMRNRTHRQPVSIVEVINIRKTGRLSAKIDAESTKSVSGNKIAKSSKKSAVSKKKATNKSAVKKTDASSKTLTVKKSALKKPTASKSTKNQKGR